jgi:hypothetical protein
VYLARRANRDGACWPNEGTISADTKVGLSAIKRAIKVLELCGLITINRKRTAGKRPGRTGTSNSYTLHFSKAATAAVVQNAGFLVKKGCVEAAGKPRLTVHSEPLVADDLQSTMAGLTVHSEPVSKKQEKTPNFAALVWLYKEKSKNQKSPYQGLIQVLKRQVIFPHGKGDFELGKGSTTQPVSRTRPGIFRPEPIPPGPWTPPWAQAEPRRCV